ncbi:MAG: hypothetical protein JXN59_08295 [Anaerolineae bacterium]|nr:hypothetical protein [Anaerolineae bacterium]
MSDRSDICPDPGESSDFLSEFEAECERIHILQAFISDVSHDLRTPLSIINSAAYMLNLKIEDPEQGDLIDRIRGQVKRLNQIIDDMLTMVELDSTLPSRTYVLLDISALAQALHEKFSVLAMEQQITFTCDLAPVHRVMADSTDLWLAFSNVIANGLRFTMPGGQVSVRTYARETWVVFEVADTGVGIRDEDLPHIFERFYRGDKARQTVTGGAGLGLAITRRIVDFHDGEIEVESQAGKGTTMRILLPVLGKTVLDE